jgi:uncharacterized membrane protein YphA (DoxX/SURF4 family)
MTQSILKTITGWTIILVAIISAFLIQYFEDFNLAFLLFLLFQLVVIFRYKEIFSPGMRTVSRLILGMVFLYSGFVKGVDPMGTAYRVEDYFIAFGAEWLNFSALFFSFLLNAAELVLGGMLILHVKPKLTATLVLLMMGIFTLVTLNDALNNPVPDCGCFGDALIISNWQTFYKNLVINVLVLIVFLNRKLIKQFYPDKLEWIIGFALIAIFIGFQYLNVANLPMMDFRSWKVGNRLYVENPQPVKYYLTYRNKETGETKEYLSPNYPYDDPDWMAQWEFVSQRVEDPNRIPGMDLAIIDFAGEDVTDMFLKNPDYQFLLVAWSLEETNRDSFKELENLYKHADSHGISFIGLTATLPGKIQQFLEMENITFDLPFFNADDITLKTMIRSNPGLILIKDGEIIDKWHHNHLPTWDELDSELPELTEK